MEVIFLKRSDLSVIDFAFTSSSSITLDNVIPQVSTFEINKEEVNVEVGDYLFVKDAQINYLGIITSIDKDEKDKHISIKTSDFISILDIKVLLNSYSGNLSIYLLNLIDKTFISTQDKIQALPYLKINRDAEVVNGALTFEDDTISSISSLLKTLNKAYGIGVKYSIVYENGNIAGIELWITKVNKGVILKHDLPIIRNLKITDNNTQTINKITFYPKKENVTYRSEVSFYLLTDGSITNDANHILRFKNIVSEAKTYADKDYSSLPTSAQSEMLSSLLEHSITFDYEIDNLIAPLFKTLNVGDFIEFISKNKVYQTMVTKIVIKSDLKTASVTLGEYRVSLTEKLKLLSRR